MYFQLMLENAQDENERKDLIMLEACEIQMERANLALDTFSQMEQLNRRASEIKAATVSKSGDFSALVAFYEEEAAKSSTSGNAEKKKNLLVRAWEAIKKWWVSFWTSFRNKIKKSGGDVIDPNDTAEIPTGFAAVKAEAGKVFGAAKAFCSQHSKDAAKALVAAIVAALTIFGISKAVKKVTAAHTRKVTGKEALKEIDECAALATEGENVIGQLQTLCEKYTGEADESALYMSSEEFAAELKGNIMSEYGISGSSPMEIVKSALSTFLHSITEIPGKIMSAFKRSKGTDTGTAAGADNGGTPTGEGVDDDGYGEMTFEEEINSILAGL